MTKSYGKSVVLCTSTEYGNSGRVINESGTVAKRPSLLYHGIDCDLCITACNSLIQVECENRKQFSLKRRAVVVPYFDYKMADRPLFIRLSMPSGLEDALEGLAREVLRAQPKDLLEFSADYFEGLLRSRNKGMILQSKNNF